jgi:ribokinase
MITVVGSINLDLIAYAARLPRPGETVAGDHFHTAPGGKGANQALAAARAGASVRIVGAVGRDAFAGQALGLLKEGGVDLTKIKETDQPTGTALIVVGEKGENIITVVPGANGLVAAHFVDSVNFRPGDCALLQLEIPVAAVSEALSRARTGNALTILNTAPYRGEATPLLRLADIIVSNETEFDLYARALNLDGVGRDECMEYFARITGRTVVVTLGAKGVVAATPSGMVYVEAHNVEPVDTVGAGDTFCGYLAASLIAGMDFEDALRRAAIAGSLACLKHGAQAAIPFAGEVDALVKRG